MKITIQITAADKACYAPLTAYTMVQCATRALRCAFPEASVFVTWADDIYGDTVWTLIRAEDYERHGYDSEASVAALVREELEVEWACMQARARQKERRDRNVRKFERGLAI